MKRKLLLVSLMIAMLVCLLAVVASATTYIYYENEVADGNELYAIKSGFDKTNRFELIEEAGGLGFDKTDKSGNALTWYVVSDDQDSNGDGIRNIVVKSTKTIGGVVGTVDENGNYTYNNDENGVSYSKLVVSANFFGTKVKTLPDAAYMATATTPPSGNNAQYNEYSQIADGSYILNLYLPRTLVAVPTQLCYRSPLITLEFEDNTALYDTLVGVDVGNSQKAYPFAFCVNLTSLTIPEGIKTLPSRAFRENLSLTYLKFPSTMTRLENDVFFRCIAFETVIFGENMEFVGYLNSEYKALYNDWGLSSRLNIKYMYVSPKINTSNSKFDSYRGQNDNYINEGRSVVFFFPGTLEEAKAVGAFTDKHFRNATNGKNANNANGIAPVDYYIYLANRTYYDNLDNKNQMHVVVYNVPKCVAFYGGVHIEKTEDNNPCIISECSRCGEKNINLYDESTHEMVESVVYEDLTKNGVYKETCKYCGFDRESALDPIFTISGYSSNRTGSKICLGYGVDKDALSVYEEMTGKTFAYGFIVSAPTVNETGKYNPLNNDLSTVDANAIKVSVDKSFVAFDFVLDGYDKYPEHAKTPIILSAYIYDGTSVSYMGLDTEGVAGQYDYATAVTQESVVEGDIHSLKINFTCDSERGSIEGEASQILKVGSTTRTVKAVAKEGYDFICWSNGSTKPELSITATEDETLVAYFTYESTGLPVVTIDTETGGDVTTKEYYINCNITLFDTEKGIHVIDELAEIKGRGNSTWTKFDKKPYKVKFDSKQNLFDFGNEKTWVLLADYRDYSLIRNMLAYNTAGSLSALGNTSKCQSVEVYLNGEYRGIYLLCEQIEVKGKNRVDVTKEDEDKYIAPEDMGYLVEMDGWADDYQVTVPDLLNNSRRYTIKHPEDTITPEHMTYIQQYLKDCIAAVQGNDYSKVEELIDVESFAQAYIIFDLFKNPDTNYSSLYFYKDAGGKLYCGPVWDFDMAIGNVSHKGNGVFEKTDTLWTAQQCPWFKGLVQFNEFKSLVGKELAENKDNIEAAIADTIAYARAHADAYKKNFTKWNILGKQTWSNPSYLVSKTTWEEHVIYVENYLAESLANLIKSYPAPAVTE